MRAIRFTLFELILLGPALFITIGIIAAGTETDMRLFAIGLHLLTGQFLGIYIQLRNRVNRMSTGMRESISVILGGALAGIGFGMVFLLITTVLFHPLWHWERR